MEDEIWKAIVNAADMLTAQAQVLFKSGNMVKAGAYAERSEALLAMAKRTREGY